MRISALQDGGGAVAHRRTVMNSDSLKGQWNVVKGKVKDRWGKLTDDDLLRMEGKRDQLVGRIQERYGITKERAMEEVSRFEGGL
jgi:uncharacterized protein YjbJ (UPF0337 family)